MDSIPSVNGSPARQNPFLINRFAVYSRILGITCLLLAFFNSYLVSFVVGGIAIILGLLSRGDSPLSRQAKIGVFSAAIGLIANAGILSYNVYLVFTVPEYRQELNRAYEQIYGTSLEEALQQFSSGQDF